MIFCFKLGQIDSNISEGPAFKGKVTGINLTFFEYKTKSVLIIGKPRNPSTWTKVLGNKLANKMKNGLSRKTKAQLQKLAKSCIYETIPFIGYCIVRTLRRKHGDSVRMTGEVPSIFK